MKLHSKTTFAKRAPFQKSPAVLSLLLFLLALAAFLPTLKNDFVNFDDPVYVLQNVNVNQGLTLAG
jgi:hypothetical protein